MRNSQKKSDYITPRELYVEVGIIENGERVKLIFITLPPEKMDVNAITKALLERG
jgi:hypothetical protein